MLHHNQDECKPQILIQIRDSKYFDKLLEKKNTKTMFKTSIHHILQLQIRILQFQIRNNKYSVELL